MAAIAVRALALVLVIVVGCSGGGDPSDEGSPPRGSASDVACREFCAEQDAQLAGTCGDTLAGCERECARNAAEVIAGCEAAYEAAWRCAAHATFECFDGFAGYSPACGTEWGTFNHCQDPSSPLPAPKPTMQACFDTTSLRTCDAYCGSIGKQCDACEESRFPGLQWGTAGTCPDEEAESVIVVLDCDDSFVYPQARCCCL